MSSLWRVFEGVIGTPTFAIDPSELLDQAATFFTQWLTLIYVVGGIGLALSLVSFVVITIRTGRFD